MSNDVRELIGQTFVGRYEILSRLGAGGMGTVYKAKHLAMEREVAIKVLNSHLVNDEASRKRFVREMKATSAIESPYTVSVHDYGTTESGEAFLVMEFLQGLTLKQILRKEKSLPLERLITITRQVASALGSAHTCDIIHRDIKPENIILLDTFDGGEWTKVLDFGIAQIGLDDTNTSQDQLTAAGTVLGTPAYMSPERARGEAFDHTSDLYALGVLMYVMATGKAPYESGEPMGVLFKHITDPIPTLKEKSNREHPPWLEKLIHALMAKDAKERPASAAEFLEMLDKALGKESLSSAETAPKEPDEALNDAPTQMLAEARPSPSKAAGDTERVGLSEKEEKSASHPPKGLFTWPLTLFSVLLLGALAFFFLRSPSTPAPEHKSSASAESTELSKGKALAPASEQQALKGDKAEQDAAPRDTQEPNLRRLASVLFTDMVGYSKLMRIDEAESLEKLRIHDTLLEKAFKEQKGRVVKRLGDGFMVEFSSSVEAVKAALAGQRALEIHNADKKEPKRIMVRMGVDVGDVIVRTNDLFGETVNVAAQIRRLAEPGTIAVTESVLTDVRGKLEASGKSLAPIHMKGRDKPTEVHLIRNGRGILNEVSPASTSALANPAGKSAQKTRVDGVHKAKLIAAEKQLKTSPAKALKAAMAILSEHPGDGETMLLTARARQALKQHGGALSTLEACRSAQPDYLPCFFELGRAYEIVGRRESAMETYEALIKAHPGSVQALEARKRLKR